MQTVIIVIHLLVVIALVGTVLIQRSEGGGLGIGGGSGFMTARGTKNALTRLTAILAACFFLTSIILTVMQLVPNKDGANILRQISGQEQKSGAEGLPDSLSGSKTSDIKSDAAAPGGQNSAETAPAGNAESQLQGGQKQNAPTLPEAEPAGSAAAKDGNSNAEGGSAAQSLPQSRQNTVQPKESETAPMQ